MLQVLLRSLIVYTVECCCNVSPATVPVSGIDDVWAQPISIRRAGIASNLIRCLSEWSEGGPGIPNKARGGMLCDTGDGERRQKESEGGGGMRTNEERGFEVKSSALEILGWGSSTLCY